MSRLIQARSERPLQDIMNMMARRVTNNDQPHEGPERGILCEADAYAHFDPVLAQLLKDHNDAQAGHKKLHHALGAADAMTMVAADMVETCHSMIETRLIVLRANAALRAQAEESLSTALAGIESGLRQNEKMRGYADGLRRESERRKAAAHDSVMWMWFLVWMLQETVRETQRCLSAVSAFSQVSQNNGRRYAAA